MKSANITIKRDGLRTGIELVFGDRLKCTKSPDIPGPTRCIVYLHGAVELPARPTPVLLDRHPVIRNNPQILAGSIAWGPDFGRARLMDDGLAGPCQLAVTPGLI